MVGVVSDARYQSLETPDVRPMMYFSCARAPGGGDGDRRARHEPGASLAPGLRDAVASIDSTTPAADGERDGATLIGEATATRRFALVLFGVFAGTALVLAAVGIYGVMSYLVRQTHAGDRHPDRARGSGAGDC